MSKSIAVIIPVYNVTAFLGDAICSAVEQRYPRQEVIVVDDGSSQKAAAEIARICLRFNHVKLLRQPHAGAAVARDRGVSHSNADFIVFLDADDVLQPGALDYFAEAMRVNPEAVAAYARRMQIDASGQCIGSPKPGFSDMVSGDSLMDLLLQARTPFCNGSICVRREALQALFAINHALTIGEDWVLWCHLALSGTIIPAGERIVLQRRKHGENITLTIVKDYSPALAALDAVFTDKKFIDAFGQNKLRTYREKCLCSIHVYLAAAYAQQCNPAKARHHLKQVTLPLASLR